MTCLFIKIVDASSRNDERCYYGTDEISKHETYIRKKVSTSFSSATARYFNVVARHDALRSQLSWTQIEFFRRSTCSSHRAFTPWDLIEVQSESWIEIRKEAGLGHAAGDIRHEQRRGSHVYWISRWTELLIDIAPRPSRDRHTSRVRK